MPPVTIDTLTPDDWELFRDFRLRALADAPEAFGSRLEDWRDAPEERWRQRLEAVPLNLAARLDGDPVGMASGALEADEVELISMWVDPAVRGTGVARTLVESVLRWAGPRPTYLNVREVNARAINAYQRMGFVGSGPKRGQAPGEPPELRMEHRAVIPRRGR